MKISQFMSSLSSSGPTAICVLLYFSCTTTQQQTESHWYRWTQGMGANGGRQPIQDDSEGGCDRGHLIFLHALSDHSRSLLLIGLRLIWPQTTHLTTAAHHTTAHLTTGHSYDYDYSVKVMSNENGKGGAELCLKKARLCCSCRNPEDPGFVIYFASETDIHNILQPGLFDGVSQHVADRFKQHMGHYTWNLQLVTCSEWASLGQQASLLSANKLDDFLDEHLFCES